MHASSMISMQKFRDDYLVGMEGATVLDIGSSMVEKQTLTYRDLFTKFDYTGMDVVPGKNVDIVGFDKLDPDGYDIIISGQVMEHVLQPWSWLQDLEKRFKKYICIIAPNSFKLHRHPVDCYRFWPDGMKALFEYAKINPISVYHEGIDTIGIGGKI